MRMMRWTVLAALMLCMQSWAKEDEGPASVSLFTGACLTVVTNAQGQVTSATVLTASALYNLLLKGMDASTLATLAKMNDKPVDIRGEVLQISNALWIKPIGSIKDVTPSLKGMKLTAVMDPNTHQIAAARLATADDSYSYGVVLKKLTPELTKDIVRLNGKKVDVEGEISQGNLTLTITGTIRESKQSSAPKKPSLLTPKKAIK